MLASGSGDKTVILWRVSDGGQLRTLEGHTVVGYPV
jgi:WD40 repeat protein